jgi:autotransporter translocation and assembly factor TamB
MKITSGRVRWAGLLKKVQAIKLNAKQVTRGAFATQEDMVLIANVNEAVKNIDVLQSKLLSWTEAQNYMLMGKHYVRKEAGGEEIAELEELATRRTEKAANDLKKEANRLCEMVASHLSNVGALCGRPGLRHPLEIKHGKRN